MSRPPARRPIYDQQHAHRPQGGSWSQQHGGQWAPFQGQPHQPHQPHQWAPQHVQYYAPQFQAPPNYVGQSWVAPPQYRPVAPAKKGGGCGVVALVLGLLMVVPVLIIGIGVVVFAFARPSPRPTATPTDPSSPTETPIATPRPMQPTGNPKTDIYTNGLCRDPSGKERDKPVYDVYAGGSARQLVGKVAIVHVRATTPDVSWSSSAELKVTESIALSSRFYTDQAKKRGVDLKLDVIPWTARTAVALPQLRILPNKMLDGPTMVGIRDAVRSSAAQALGGSLDALVRDYKKKGYDEVAFIFYFPHAIEVRDFAFRESRASGNAEVAVVFPTNKALPFLAVQVAHEGLHMFGADDLYRMASPDRADSGDLMGDYCEGFRATKIGDATAFGIGWSTAPPARRYPFNRR